MIVRNVCVLGGTGFVGRHLLAKLSAAGYHVKVLTRNREGSRHLWVLPEVDVVEANVYDEAELRRQFVGVDAVINLIGILHEQRKGDFTRTHAELPVTVAKACLEVGVPRLLHMSALNADEHGPSRYLRTKGEGEASVLHAADHGLKVTVFRPAVIFGPEDNFLNLFARLAKLAPIMPLACPGTRFQPVYVEDVAQAYVSALDNPATFGKRYDLCGPKAYTLARLVRYAAGLRGACPVIWRLGDRLSYWQARLMELSPVKLITRDNYYSMQIDSVCNCAFPAVFGIQPQALEAVVPSYLALE